MRIQIASVLVEDQAKALVFYTGILGFTKKLDIPLGGDNRWLTLVSPEGPDELELLLEPPGFAPARTYQQALKAAGIPATTFAAADVRAEHARLADMGVVFTTEPVEAGGTVLAVFDDTCGNLIQIHQG